MSRKTSIDVFQPKITRNDRFAQMSHQEMVIEQKKREILAKIEQKQKGNATTTATATSVTPSNPPPAKVSKITIPNPSLFTFNTFSNDGSFLDQFKQLKEKKPETRPRIIIKNSNNNKGLDKEKKLTDAKSGRWPGNKDSKATSRVSRFNERTVPQFDCKMSISTTYSNNIDKNNIDNPQTVVSNTITVSPQAVTGQPLLKNALMSSKLSNKLQRHQRNVIINDINLISNLQQNQVNINRVISTINDINMGINKNINVMANISTPSMILSVPPPSVLVSISEPPPLLNQTTLPNLINLTVNLASNQSLLPDPQHQISVLVPLPPPPLPNISPVLPLPPGLTAPGIPTLELSSIPPPNPIQIRNIPQPEPLNTLSIPPPAPLQVQNIPPPSPLQLTEIPNPKPMDLMNIPTPAEGLSADFITSIPPPNKCVPPPSVDISSAVNVNVSIPPPTTTVIAAVGATLSHLPPNVSIPPPMQQPPPPTLQQTIQQQVMLPPPPPPTVQQQQQQQQQQSQARLVTTTPPPMPSLNNPPLLSIPTNAIPALMAHPVLPPPPPSPQQSTTLAAINAAQLLVQQHQQQQALNAALNAVGSLIGPSVPPPPLNMSCPPPPTAAALMAADFERARAETMHHHSLLQQVQKMQAQQVGLAPSGGQPPGAMATAPPFVLNTNTVFTAGSVEFEVMAQMARVVARCGNSVQDVLLQRKPRDPDLWFLHQPHDSPIYRQYQQLVEQFRAELQGDVNAHSAQQMKTATTDNNGAAALVSAGTDNYRPEDIYDPDEAIADEDCVSGIGGPGFGSTSGGRDEFMEDNSFAFTAGESAEDRRRRKRKSRWGGQSASNSLSTPSIMPQIPTLHSMPQTPQTMISFPSNVTSTINPHNTINNPMLTKLIRTDPALLQYAQQTFGSTNLSEEDWKKAEDHYKINLLYQDMLRKRQEVERLQKAGKFKYDYDSDEELDEVGGTWEHRLREKEMTATNLWAAELTKQAEGKHHIGDFLPPEEYKKFMEKSQAAREGRTPDISDYKEFKLKEDNVGFKMLQKLGWSEGQGLGAGGTGIVEPVNKSSQRDLNQGLGVGDENMVSNDDDEYDSYRKRMMLAYRFRPNPLNNPRRPYY